LDYKGNEIIIDTNNIKDSILLKLQVITTYLSFFVFGLSDETIGVLIPVFVKEYHSKESTISLLYFAQFFGYFIISLFNDQCHKIIGFHGVATLSVLFMGLCSFIAMFQPPFFILILAYVLCGVGAGAQDAAVSVWLGKLDYSNELSNLLHASYGVGCICSPLIVTRLLLAHNISWKFHYGLIFVLTIVLTLLNFLVFRHETKWKYEWQLQNESSLNLDEPRSNDNSLQPEDTSSDIRNAIRNSKVLALAAFLFLNVGTEVVIGGWTLSYLIKVKNGSMNEMSVVVSTFWFGLTIGRVILGFITPRLSSEYFANHIYNILSIFFFALFYLSSSYWFYIATIFSTGIFIGPIFPTTSVYAIKVLPVHLHVSGVGFAMALGGGGAAILPWFVGICCE
ncbi:Bsc6p, partial [Ascoidea rubescens DSM 1968]